MSFKDFDNRGVYSLLITPFNEDRSVDYTAFERYADWQSRQGVQHLFAVCGSSEMTELTLDEREKIASLAVKNSNGVPVVATANIEPGWYSQLEEIKRIENTGVKGLVFVTRGYGNDQERMFSYLSELSTHTELPIVLYEFPGFSPHIMEGDTYGRLVKTGRFVGIKDTTCLMDKIKDKIVVQGDSAVLQANIPYLMEAYLAGARGVIATPTSCGAALFARMYDEFTNGNIEAANKTHQEICLLDDAIGNGFCASAKYLISLCGIQMNWYTRGNHNLNPQRLKAIRVFYEWATNNGIEFYKK